MKSKRRIANAESLRLEMAATATGVAVGVSPAVEPARPARRKRRGYGSQLRAFVSGGKLGNAVSMVPDISVAPPH